MKPFAILAPAPAAILIPVCRLIVLSLKLDEWHFFNCLGYNKTSGDAVSTHMDI
jgi:hypothetical protein